MDGVQSFVHDGAVAQRRGVLYIDVCPHLDGCRPKRASRSQGRASSPLNDTLIGDASPHMNVHANELSTRRDRNRQRGVRVVTQHVDAETKLRASVADAELPHRHGAHRNSVNGRQEGRVPKILDDDGIESGLRERPRVLSPGPCDHVGRVLGTGASRKSTE